jgi:hypothetical protein
LTMAPNDLFNGMNNAPLMTSDYEGMSIRAGANGIDWNGTSQLPVGRDYSSIPIRGYQFFEDFETDAPASPTADKPYNKMTVRTNGTAADVFSIATYGITGFDVGYLQLQTGTTAVGRAGVFTNLNSFNVNISAGAATIEISAKIRIPVIATSAQNFAVYMGLLDRTNPQGVANCAMMNSSDFNAPGGTSVQPWVNASAAGSISTPLGPNGVIQANKWHIWTIRFEPSKIQPGYIDFTMMVDGTVQGIYNTPTNQTAFPFTGGQVMGLAVSIVKISGTTNTKADIDWISCSVIPHKQRG